MRGRGRTKTRVTATVHRLRGSFSISDTAKHVGPSEKTQACEQGNCDRKVVIRGHERMRAAGCRAGCSRGPRARRKVRDETHGAAVVLERKRL